MKKIFVIMLVAVAFTACNQNAADKVEDKIANLSDTTAGEVASADAPKFEFDKEIFDFGVVEEGETVKTVFKFKNTGKTPLIITDASATCGCTVPEYPKTPIKPGESGEISVSFNSQGRLGMQDKIVTIKSNASPEAQGLHLVGEVKEKK
jgi:hypothetical protein